jgi:predicted DNA-binding helix-hairpin-helix protein
LDIDPKLSWALRNLHLFPIDINKADKRILARIPGVGMQSVFKILQARKFRNLDWSHLQSIA